MWLQVKKVGKYEIGRTLGEGTFGKVKYAVNTETGKGVAIKILDKEKIQKQNMGAQIKKEISIMKMVKHDHVVKLYEVLASRTKIFIVLELITGGELFDKIVAEGKFNEDTARFYFRQLVTGVKYCHNQGVCHRDLKPENLLLDESGLLKISDFGLSALYTGASDDTSRATLLHTTCGTPNYVAPEVLNDKGYDGRAADVWSMGVILYVLLAGYLPFDEPHMSALFRKIQKAEFEYPRWFSPEVKGLLNKILVPNPEDRISVEGIQADPWFIHGGFDPTTVSAPPPSGLPKTAESAPAAAAAPGGGGSAAAASAGAGASATAPAEGGEDAGAAMRHVPSAKDMEDAVTEGVAVEEGSDKEGPKLLNAFDVVNMFGGMALNRMLSTEDESKVNRSPQFISAAAPREILERIHRSLIAMECEPKVDDVNYKVKATIRTPKGEISIIVNIYALSESLRFVEMHRGKGDLLEYNRIYQAIKTDIADLIKTPSSAPAAGRPAG